MNVAKLAAVVAASPHRELAGQDKLAIRAGNRGGHESSCCPS
jgi:hypothetical protein